MTSLDQTGHPPLRGTPIGMSEPLNSSQKSDQSDFGRWLPHRVGGKEPAAPNPSDEPEISSSMAQIVAVPSIIDDTEADTVAMLYAWQLRSQAYLSQLASMGAGRVVRLEGNADASQVQAQGSRPFPGIGLGAQGVVGNVGDTSRPNALGSSNVYATFSAATSNGARARDAMTGALASTNWMERMLRSVQQSDCSITLWLRDYRLVQSEVSAAVDELLRTHPDRERVVRVVVNGNEVWRNESMESRSE